MNIPIRIKTINEFHQFRGLPAPEHPQISIINFDEMDGIQTPENLSWIMEFYSISMKRMPKGTFKYGQHTSDFDNGLLFFTAPNQVMNVEFHSENPEKPSGWFLLIHPDFLWGTALAKKIHLYEFFDYSVYEALHLSEKEERTLNSVIQNIQQETHSNIDKFSQQIIVSQIETLLNYSERFYERQFITRKKVNHQVLDKLDDLLNAHFNSDNLTIKGLPIVAKIAEELNVSPNYLSGLLKSLTGQNTQQIIHEKLIEKAKEKLSTTNLTVSEIAYELGFEQPQSFSRIFKNKTNQTPLEFRESFN